MNCYLDYYYLIYMHYLLGSYTIIVIIVLVEDNEMFFAIT